jgi:hypothetical protein
MHGFSFDSDHRRWNGLDTWDWDDVGPTVCVVHLRYVPCRKGEPESRCHISTNQKAVEIVREYQLSNITESEAHARMDRIQEFE